MIYRFVTRGSVEERITEVAKRKMMLTHLVVRPGMGTSSNAPSLSKREMDDILRFGTEELFKEENVGGQGDTTIHYDDRAINALLDREQEGEVDEGPGSENLLANEYLSSFKVASYVMKEKEAEVETEVLKEDVTASQQPDPDFWEKLLRHHYEQQKELEAAKLGKGKRIRKQVNYLDAGEVDKTGRDSDQSSYKQSSEDSTEEESDDGDEYAVGGVVKKVKKREKKSSEAPLPPLLAKNNGSLLVLGFNPRHRKGFLNSVMRYGMPPANAFQTKWRPRELKSFSENAFNAYVNMFMRHLCEPDNPDATTYTDEVPKETVSRQNILTRIGIMRLVRNKIDQYTDINGEYSIADDAIKAAESAKAVAAAAAADKPPPSTTGQAKESTNQDAAQTDPSTKDESHPVSGDKDTTSCDPTTTQASTTSEEAKPESEIKEEGVKVENMETTPTVGGASESKSKEEPGLSDIPDKLGEAEVGEKEVKKEEEEEEKMEIETEGSSTAEKNAEVKVDAADEGDKVGGALDINEAGSLKEVKEKRENGEAAPLSGAEKPRSRESSVIVYTPPSKPGGGAKTTHSLPTKPAAGSTAVPRFMFNIADGGFTELHSLWADEKTKGFSETVWGRHHDYWLLKGIVTHGYCRWSEMCGDLRFNLLNKPFGPNVDSNMSDSKSRFMLKRFKLLEQALAVEEQLHRASNAGLVQDPNHSVMQLHSRYTDLDCLADGHVPLISDCLKHKKSSILLMKKALGKMEELLMEMKSDVSRLPSELGKITSVSTQLKMDEISTISKAAHKETAPVIVNNNSTGNRPSTVITNSPDVATTVVPTIVGGTTTNVGGVISERSKQLQTTQQRSASPRHKRTAEEKVSIVTGSALATATPPAAATAQVAYATTTGGTLQLPAGSLLQTADGGIVVYQGASSNAVGAQKTAAVVQQTPVVTQAANNAQTYAIGVPTYVDGSGGTAAAAVYLQGLPSLQGQTVQLVQVSGGGAQQMVYWPSVVQGGQAVTTTQAGAQIAVLTTDASGAPVITID